MEYVIREALCEAGGKIFKRNDTISSMLCVPGLIFLKYMTHAYDKLLEDLQNESEDVNKNEMDTYSSILNGYKINEKVIIIPSNASWEYILDQANSSKIDTYLDEAMNAIETMNKSFQTILPQEYSSPNIKIRELSSFIKMLGEIPAEHNKTNSILRHTFDYIVRKKLSLSLPSESGIHLKENFYAPKCVEQLMVSIVEPKEGKIFDPCSRFGSLLVESMNFLNEHRQSFNGMKVTFYGQEAILSCYRLCCMNLAMHGIGIEHMKLSSESSINRDIHNDLKADIILSAPPYNSSVFSWIDYVLSHLSRKGCAALLLSKNSLLIKNGNRYRIHNKLLEHNGVDCFVTLPDTLFPMAGISLCILILAKDRGGKRGKNRYRRNEILFIDAESVSKGKKAVNKELSTDDINDIASIYHQWREKHGGYMDKKGFCKTVKIADKNFISIGL